MPKVAAPFKPIEGVDPFVQINPVSATTGMSPRTLRRRWEKQEFPKPIRLGGKLVWRLSTIRNWMDEIETSQS